MVVLAIIAIIAAIALPNLIRSRMSAAEASAVSSMRLISTSQVAYQAAAHSDSDNDGNGDYGTLAELADPDGSGATPPYIDRILGAGTKQGYTFTIDVIVGNATTNPQYVARAAPMQIGSRNFYADEEGVLRFTTDGTDATVTSKPL
jgi:type II secretory pathway pseudopilin PulG